jgi:hypothetical protein
VHGKALYRKRHATIEPVFGQIKFNRRLDRFLRRGRSAAKGLNVSASLDAKSRRDGRAGSGLGPACPDDHC